MSLMSLSPESPKAYHFPHSPKIKSSHYPWNLHQNQSSKSKRQIPETPLKRPFSRRNMQKKDLFSPETKLITFDKEFNITPSQFCIQKIMKQFPVSATPAKKKLFMNDSSSEDIESMHDDISEFSFTQKPSVQKKNPTQLIATIEENDERDDEVDGQYKVLKNKFENEFEVKKKIGEGNFSIVYQVASRIDGLEYAIKKSKEVFKGYNDRDLKLKEVQRWAKISNFHSPNKVHCLKFHEAWEENGYLYISAELCEEGSLHEFLEKNQNERNSEMWEKNLLAIFKQMCLGLKHIHDSGFIHMDIKPSNFQVTKEGIVKCGDFGQAIPKNSSPDDVNEGDSVYLAPEVFDILNEKREDLLNEKIDVFCLGMSFYEIIENTKLPSYGEKWKSLREGKVCFKRSAQEVSGELKNLVLKMLEPNQSLRIDLNSVLSNPLFSNISTLSIAPAPKLSHPSIIINSPPSFNMEPSALFASFSSQKGHIGPNKIRNIQKVMERNITLFKENEVPPEIQNAKFKPKNLLKIFNKF